MILYCIITAFVNSVTSGFLGLLVLLRRPRDWRNRTFAGFAASVALWSVFYLLWQLAETPEESLRYVRLLTAAAIFPPVTYFHFVSELIGSSRRKEVFLAYGVAVVLAIASFSPIILAGTETKLVFPNWPVPGPLYPLYLAAFAVAVIVTVYRLVQRIRESEGRRRDQLRFVMLGTTIGFVGGSTNFFLWYDVPILPVGNGLVALYVIGVGYSIVRLRLMEFDVLLARIAVYSALVVCVAMVVPTIAYLGEQVSLFGNTGARFGLVFAASLVVVALLFAIVPAARTWVDKFLAAQVLGDLRTGHEKLRGLAQNIATVGDQEMIFREAVDTVGEVLGVKRLGLFYRGLFDREFHLQAANGWNGAKSIKPDSSLASQLQKFPEHLVAKDFAEWEQSPEAQKILLECVDLGVEVAIPIYLEQCLWGMMLCGKRDNGRYLSSLELAMLETLCLQVGMGVRTRELERRSNEAEKLISLGTLAAGLAHEMRNPLVSIRTFSDLLEEQGGDPDFRKEFTNVMTRDVDRIITIIENVSAFAQDTHVPYTGVSVREVVRGVSEITSAEFERLRVSYECDDRDLPDVHGSYSQLLQVFLNLFQNALRALEDRPNPSLKVGFDVTNNPDGESPFVVVSITDNGCGVKEAIRTKIFEPFVTSKSTGDQEGRRGMGLGLAMVKRIIDSHQGAITVKTREGHGTSFYVHLPTS